MMLILPFCFFPPSPVTESNNSDTVSLICSVLTYGECRHRVDWLYEGNEEDTVIRPHTCSATVTFTTSHLNPKAKYLDSLKCNVTDIYTKEVKLFPLRRRSSPDEPGETIPDNVINDINLVCCVFSHSSDSTTQHYDYISHFKFSFQISGGCT